jgi:hypothetical protein
MTAFGLFAPDVLCPICLDNITVPDELYEQVVEDLDTKWVPLDLTKNTNPVKEADQRSRAYFRCPNPSEDGTPEHYLPIAHRDYGKPIVIGLVGRGSSGKTHLLVAMVAHALRGDLGSLGLTFEPADRLQHAVFRDQIDRFTRGERLLETADLLHGFAEYVVVRTTAGAVHPLVFFDVAGEDFDKPGRDGRGARFLLGATALMFVDDPARAIPSLGPAPDSVPNRENPAFLGALERLRSRKDMRDIPVAVVLAKADELRYEHPVDHWLRRDGIGEPLSAKAFLDESRDVYAFLDRHGAQQMIAAYEQFDQGTLHFVSATGSAAGDNNRAYPRGVKPARVLQPLIALLAMAGVINHQEARKVGL